jgi:DNA-binding transcriptional regulator YiaG
MFPFPFDQHRAESLLGIQPTDGPHTTPPLPCQTDPTPQSEAERRLAILEVNEPKRRLIRDAKALAKLRKITQAQMADEMGVPRRTLEEWLQFRRMPKAPGTTLIRRWVEAYQG